MPLSARLQGVLDFVVRRETKVLADIGTDHAFLPIEACRLNVCERAIACDLNKGPAKIAARNIESAGLSHRIETRVGDGLQPLSPGEADCIAICGMGGVRMWNILKDRQEQARLILQPQQNLPEFRNLLTSNGYDILDEQMVLEDSQFYVIFSAIYAGSNNTAPWTEKECFLGRHLMAKNSDSEMWQLYLSEKRAQIERYIHVNHEPTREHATQRLNWIKEEERK